MRYRTAPLPDFKEEPKIMGFQIYVNTKLTLFLHTGYRDGNRSIEAFG